MQTVEGEREEGGRGGGGGAMVKGDGRMGALRTKAQRSEKGCIIWCLTVHDGIHKIA